MRALDRCLAASMAIAKHVDAVLGIAAPRPQR
jgi:hypothetical protein